MIRKRIREVLVLFVCGSAVWWGGSAFQATVPSSVPPILSLTPILADGTPKPAITRGFDADRPLGLGLLDQRAEVLFDN